MSNVFKKLKSSHLEKHCYRRPIDGGSVLTHCFSAFELLYIICFIGKYDPGAIVVGAQTHDKFSGYIRLAT